MQRPHAWGQVWFVENQVLTLNPTLSKEAMSPSLRFCAHPGRYLGLKAAKIPPLASSPARGFKAPQTRLAFVVLDIYSSLSLQQERDQFRVAIQGSMVQG